MAKKNKEKLQHRGQSLVVAIRVFFLALAISIAMSTVSQSVLSTSGLVFSLVILFIIITIGVVFDIIGVAVTVCDEAPFHSMAAKKNLYAVKALKLIKRAPLVASFCNDVVGDIAGIISGAAVASIVYSMMTMHIGDNLAWLSVLLSGFVAAITVAGKAYGKELAVNKSKEITLGVAKILYFLDYIFTLKWMKEIGR